jgi:hypothetical protein
MGAEESAGKPRQAVSIKPPSIVRTDDGILPQLFQVDANRRYDYSMGIVKAERV